MNLYTYPVQSKDVQFNQTETTMVTAALTLRAQARNKWALSVNQGDSDTVAISDEAKALAAASSGQQETRATVATGLSASGKADEDSSTSAAEQAKDKIQKRIRELQQEIAKVQADATLSEEERNKRVQQLQTELMSLMSELQKQSGGQEYKGGTQAAGFVKSIVEKLAAESGT